LGHLLAASRVGAVVEAARLPVDPDVLAFAGGPRRALTLALTGGEDYELLLAVPRRRASAVERACARAKQRVSYVGTLVPARGVHLVDGRGRRTRLQAPGFDHFAGRRA
jgi:thiamine-monophosphate kinase